MKPATTFTHIVLDVAGLPQQPRLIVDDGDACGGGAGSGARIVPVPMVMSMGMAMRARS